MTESVTYKDLCLSKYQNENALELINRKLLIHKQLEKPPRNYVVYSDLHGSYEKFLHWLKNGMGFYRIAVRQSMGESYSQSISECYEQLLYVINRNRFHAYEEFVDSDEVEFNDEVYFFEPVPRKFCEILAKLEAYGLTKRRVLLDCINLLRDITRGDERRVIKLVPHSYLENILKLYHQSDEESFEGLVKGVVENPVIYQLMCSVVIRLVVSNIFDKHINLGDTFDRGEEADKLVKLYRAYFGSDAKDTPMHYIWGNHDILWLGAAIGNPILCVEAIRISLRYNNVAFLRRYGFDLSKIEALAMDTYKLMPEGAYVKGKDFNPEDVEKACKMTKMLLMLQMKLTLKCLEEVMHTEGEIDYAPEYQRHRDLLASLPTNLAEDLDEWQAFKKEKPHFKDVYFPSIDPTSPDSLTQREQEVVDDLVYQFTHLPKLQEDMMWMFRNGETYRIVDNTLYFHAAIPADDEGRLVGFRNRSGKDLLDYVQSEVRRIAEKSKTGLGTSGLSMRESMLFWYLWCGKESPFFCKSKMATLERAIFDKDLTMDDPLLTHKESSNPFYKHIRNNVFLNTLLDEFHAEKICMGHTPVKTMKQAVLSQSIHAFIIDGGASAAYGDRGAVLIYTPDYLYLTFHPALEDLKKAETENRLPDIQVHPLEERGRRKLKDMEKGFYLEKELEAIDQILTDKLASFESEYFC